MACCIIAAYLWAMAVERLRLVAMFWGIVQPRSGEIADTAYARLSARLRREAPKSEREIGPLRLRVTG